MIDGPGVVKHKPFEEYSLEIENAVNSNEILVESSGPTETILLEAAANSQSAQSVCTNTDAGVIELFGID